MSDDADGGKYRDRYGDEEDHIDRWGDEGVTSTPHQPPLTRCWDQLLHKTSPIVASITASRAKRAGFY